MSVDQVEVFCVGRRGEPHQIHKIMTLRRNPLVFQDEHGRYAVEVIDYDNGPQLEPITGDAALFYDLLAVDDAGPALPGVKQPRPWEPVLFAPVRERRRYDADLTADLARIQTERAAGMTPEHRWVEPPRTAERLRELRESGRNWIEGMRKKHGRRTEDVILRDEHGNPYRCGMRFLFDLRCPSCGLGVQVQEPRFYSMLDKLAVAGLARVSMAELSSIFGAS